MKPRFSYDILRNDFSNLIGYVVVIEGVHQASSKRVWGIDTVGQAKRKAREATPMKRGISDDGPRDNQAIGKTFPS
jgi:hypothetical protein